MHILFCAFFLRWWLLRVLPEWDGAVCVLRATRERL